MLMTKDRRPAIRTLRGWAISVLLEDRRHPRVRGAQKNSIPKAGPHPSPHALVIARQEPPCGFSPEQAVAEVRNMLEVGRRHLPGVPAGLTRGCGR